MEEYPLQALLQVRRIRENKARTAVATAQKQLAAARALLEEKKVELENYRRWRVEEEERLLNDLIGKPVRVGVLTDTRMQIASMREKEIDYQDAIRQAEKKVDEAEEALADARRKLAKATREMLKLEEHRSIWREEQRLEQERFADAELEDFQVPQRKSVKRR